jgi:hypothetical protein
MKPAFTDPTWQTISQLHFPAGTLKPSFLDDSCEILFLMIVETPYFV